MSTEEQEKPENAEVEAGQTTNQEEKPPETAEQQDQPAEPEVVQEESFSTEDIINQFSGATDNSAVEALQAEVESLKDELLRSQADMQNLRRRVDRDVEKAHKFALEKFVAELVSVVDNLERATSAIDRDNEHLNAVGEGVELTLKGLMDVLGKFNVEQIDPAGQPFDPEKHQAMTMVPNPNMAPNTVMEVFQKGYLLNGRLVRAAMVVVSQDG